MVKQKHDEALKSQSQSGKTQLLNPVCGAPEPGLSPCFSRPALCCPFLSPLLEVALVPISASSTWLEGPGMASSHS